MNEVKCSCSSQKTFCNPLNLNYTLHNDAHGGEIPIQPFREGADPSIELFEDTYYLVSSATNGYWCSPDMLNWEFIDAANSPIPFADRWAPTIVAIDGVLYLYFGQGNIYKTRTPRDVTSWTEIPDTCEHTGDPQFFYDRDTGRLWLTHGCSNDGCIRIHELDIFTMKRKGDICTVKIEDHENRGFECQGDNCELDQKGWTEGSQMIKYQGIYYLIYSGHQLDNSYANGVLTAPAPCGPFTFQSYNPFSQKLTGFIGGAAHGQVFWDKYGNLWNVVLQSVWVNHRWERRIALFPSGFTPGGQLNTDTLFGDYPILLPEKKLTDPIASRSAGFMLLSRNCPVQVSTELPAHKKENAVTEDVRTYWSARTGEKGEWIQMCVGESSSVFCHTD